MKEIAKITNKFVKKRCELMVEEKDLIKVFGILDNKKVNNGLHISKPKDASLSQKGYWYIMFNVSEQHWSALVKEFKLAHLSNILIPTKDNFGNVFYQNI